MIGASSCLVFNSSFRALFFAGDLSPPDQKSQSSSPEISRTIFTSTIMISEDGGCLMVDVYQLTDSEKFKRRRVGTGRGLRVTR